MFGFDFAPRGWSFLDGQVLPIAQNQALYSLLGTTYGGDGRTSFALPDLRGRTPVHAGNGFSLGEKGGNETVTLTESDIPAHTHFVHASSQPGNVGSPDDNVLAGEVAPDLAYGDDVAGTRTTLQSASVTHAGGSQGHENMQPYETLNFCIAMQGLFPSRN
jgi:microcystin-dependent protein